MEDKKFSIKDWCKEHKKELIIGGTVAVGIGGIIVYKRVKSAKLAKLVLEKELENEGKVLLDAFGDDLGVSAHDILFQNIVSENIPGFNTEKVISVAPDISAIKDTFSNYLEQLVDIVGEDNVKNITVCYDLEHKW